MLNDLMWVLFAHLALLFIFVAPTVALVWVAHVFAKALTLASQPPASL